MTTECKCNNLRGAIAAQDERERLAGDRCGIPYHEYGCDWPDRMADEVLALRIERDNASARVLEHAWTMFQEQLRECEYDAQRCPSETRLSRLHTANLYNNTLALLLRQTKGEER